MSIVTIEEQESLQRGIEALLENRFVVRGESPVFSNIRKNEKEIRKFLQNFFGYRLKLDNQVANVYKVPAVPRDWMGVSSFNAETNYMFLMAIYAFLEKKSNEDRFLLSELVDETKAFLYDIYEVEWKSIHNRRSLWKALQFAIKNDVVHLLEGTQADSIAKDSEEITETEDVLFVVRPMIRYMFRSFTKPIREFDENEELLTDDVDVQNVTHALMRKLYFEPVLFEDELTDEERNKLSDKRFFQQLQNGIQHYTPFHLERTPGSIYLVKEERTRGMWQHPNDKSPSIVMSHFSTIVKERILDMDEKPFGEWVVENYELDSMVNETYERFAKGWAKEFRQMSKGDIKQFLIAYASEWKLAFYDARTLQFTIYPTIIRTTGNYPEEEEIDAFHN